MIEIYNDNNNLPGPTTLNFTCSCRSGATCPDGVDPARSPALTIQSDEVHKERERERQSEREKEREREPERERATLHTTSSVGIRDPIQTRNQERPPSGGLQSTPFRLPSLQHRASPWRQSQRMIQGFKLKEKSSL